MPRQCNGIRQTTPAAETPRVFVLGVVLGPRKTLDFIGYRGVCPQNIYWLSRGLSPKYFKRSVMVGGLPFEGRLITRDNEAQRAFASMRQKIESAQEDDPTIDEINAMNTYRPSGAIGDKRNLLRGSHLLKAIFERLGGHLQTLPPQVG